MIISRLIMHHICGISLTRPNSALDKRTILSLYVPGFHRQVFKYVKVLSKSSKNSKEQKRTKGASLLRIRLQCTKSTKGSFLVADLLTMHKKNLHLRTNMPTSLYILEKMVTQPNNFRN